VSSFAALRQKHRIVIDVNTGEAVTVDQVLGDADYGTVVGDYRMRMQLEGLDGTYRYICPQPECCDQMVLKKVRSQDKDPFRFYFKHRHNENVCAGTEHLSAREICALKFNGAKESADHFAFKRRIVESIEADPTFEKPETEKRWVDDTNGKWRQPDVQVKRGGERIALEVQLSTTFLHVIAERRKFYRDTGGRLIWLFRDLNILAYRQAEDDIFYANNWNAFRITDQAVEQSCREHRLALECGWFEPVIRSEGITFEERKKQIYFDELKFDVGKNGVPRAYFFDTEAARERAERIGRTLPLVRRFETYWLKEKFNADEWRSLREGFSAQGVSLPEYPHTAPFEQLLHVLYSVKHGRMVDYGYTQAPFLDLAHHVFDRRKGFMRVFEHAMETYGRTALLTSEKNYPRFEAKAVGPNGYRRKIADRDPAYVLDPSLHGVVAFLFPELDAAFIC